eukprot:CAMPEP_0185763610 /NCGR_PEP_ID=MMETSP1174-20130828/22533_1 /TAXON_ID=35687 /ORGANISM="Dictyocha speculum, Strain CCMP1381" /LENGTH=142 /DNA_ID=CAMNT_0028445801 /DNA_START=1011 /DNA_END=1439 /DNA_ORIENTATION=+
MSDDICDIALGAWAMWGVKRRDVKPVDKFCFAEFILAAKAAVLLPISFLYFTLVGVTSDTWNTTDTTTGVIAGIGVLMLGLYYVYSAIFKLYYSYIAWSFCYITLKDSLVPTDEENCDMGSSSHQEMCVLSSSENNGATSLV